MLHGGANKLRRNLNLRHQPVTRLTAVFTYPSTMNPPGCRPGSPSTSYRVPPNGISTASTADRSVCSGKYSQYTDVTCCFASTSSPDSRGSHHAGVSTVVGGAKIGLPSSSKSPVGPPRKTRPATSVNKLMSGPPWDSEPAQNPRANRVILLSVRHGPRSQTLLHCQTSAATLHTLHDH